MQHLPVVSDSHQIGESFLYVALADHRNLNGIYTDFIELLRKKSLEEIFVEMLLTQEIIYHSASTNKIFNKNH